MGINEVGAGIKGGAVGGGVWVGIRARAQQYDLGVEAAQGRVGPAHHHGVGQRHGAQCKRLKVHGGLTHKGRGVFHGIRGARHHGMIIGPGKFVGDGAPVSGGGQVGGHGGPVQARATRDRDVVYIKPRGLRGGAVPSPDAAAVAEADAEIDRKAVVRGEAHRLTAGGGVVGLPKIERHGVPGLAQVG